ncbi:PREDICTED: venom allergen 3-like [Acropora digitifera]|uniref:venom allergen 3-like n=1 Tax=Acropora digitifera TaxID=70779 RepID=UPI00077A2629|nr:PREDICTED: venom allergen 3-like [Acropora digitifera]
MHHNFAVLLLSLPILLQAVVSLPFKVQCVRWHNRFRAKHQARPVKWDPALANDAKKWANYLAANNLFQHDRNRRNQGENLYLSSKKPANPCIVATQRFYDEVKYYNFKKPGFSSRTGHFTQVVWKSTKRKGGLLFLFASPVTWDPVLANDAKKWANYLAANNLFQHDRNRRNQGENLYWSSKKPANSCIVATQHFYDEVKYYDFNKPGFSSRTGHFTQVVWKSTKRIGAAYATRKDGSFVVVIRYSPPGNYKGEDQFRNNVLPAKGGDGSVMSSLSPRGENGGKRGCSSDISSLIIFAVITIRLFV